MSIVSLLIRKKQDPPPQASGAKVIQAELRGKLLPQTEVMEDVLTSNVFGFLKYANRGVYLKGFLQTLKIHVPDSALDQAEFLFWPCYDDRTEPDLVIMVGDYYILVEAKHMSPFGAESEDKKEQLVRECNGGSVEASSSGKIFRFITITSHYTCPNKLFAHLPDHIKSSLQWINWHAIAALLLKILDDTENPPDKGFATDLYNLLDKKKLRSFLPFNRLSRQFQPPPQKIFFNAEDAVFRGKFIGFHPSLVGFPTIAIPSSRLFFTRTFFRPLLRHTIDRVEIKFLLGAHHDHRPS